MLQALLAYSVVAISALYVGWKFMPAAWRWWCSARIGALFRRFGLAGERIARLEAKMDSGGACGSCNACNACDVNKLKVRT